MFTYKNRYLWGVLLGMLILLELAYVIAYKTQFLLPLFDLNGEANVPTWYTSSILLLAGFLALVVSLKQVPTEKRAKAFWLLLSAACFLISLDEIAQLHEKFDLYTPVKWIFVYVPVGLIANLILFRYIVVYWQVKPNLRVILFGILVAFILSIGFEYLSYLGIASSWQKFEYMIEEGAEILGASMILIGCLQEVELFNPKA